MKFNNYLYLIWTKQNIHDGTRSRTQNPAWLKSNNFTPEPVRPARKNVKNTKYNLPYKINKIANILTTLFHCS